MVFHASWPVFTWGGVEVFKGPRRNEPAKKGDLMDRAELKEACFVLREKIEALKAELVQLNNGAVGSMAEVAGRTALPAVGEHPWTPGEMLENLKLAFRHLEDARMRLGKAIQAIDGGKSCYPR